MRVYPVLFTLVAPPGIGGVDTMQHGEITFRLITEKQARTLWEQGFAHLHITTAGAAHYYGDATLPEQIALLKHCRNASEVSAIRALSDSATMRKAAAARLAELAPEQPVARGPQPAAAQEEQPAARGPKPEAPKSTKRPPRKRE